MSDVKEPEGHYEEGFTDKKPGRALATYQAFETELRTREKELATMLPTHVSRERFINSAMAAVKQNPALLNCTSRSLFTAITKSAQDGLLPDGREGVITSYNTKTKGGWKNQASWNPMVGGLRKRARELDDILIDAQVVHENDVFVWHQGDDPHIEHTPAKLGTPRGQLIGAYAIFKREEGTILHREVMDVEQIETTRKQSKAPDSLMWTKFQSEGYRKAVIRRGIKTVPVSEKLETVIRRDDDLFDFDAKEPVPIIPPSPPSPPPAPSHTTALDVTPLTPEPVTVVTITAEPTPAPEQQMPKALYDNWLSEIYAELAACETEDAVADLRDRSLVEMNDGDVENWRDACAEKATEIFSRG